MLLERWHVIRRAIERGYDVHSIWPCFVRWDHGDVWEVDVDHPLYPRAREGDPQPQAAAAIGEGAGTELKKLLAAVGISASAACSCNARAKAMNDNGVEWCRKNVGTIVGWLEEEAARRRLPFVRAAAWLLVKRAISNARKRHSP